MVTAALVFLAKDGMGGLEFFNIFAVFAQRIRENRSYI